MPVIISEEEKKSIQDYFNYPERYISDKDMERLGGILPDCSKVSRAKYSDESDYIPRQYIISRADGETLYIPITTPFPDDPGTHSATIVQGKIYFHQNKDDLPKKLPDNFEDYCEIGKGEKADEWIVKYRAVWAKALGKPDYVHSVTRLGLFNKTIKYAVDAEGNRYYLKSHSSFKEGIVSLPNHTEQYGKELYVGPPIFRRNRYQTKRIDITRDAGENLEKFLLANRDKLSSIEIELLAREILKQYLIQINNQRLVHTDIKPTNICVKINRAEGLGFDVAFIDWDEAFYIENPSLMGIGTPGYMAPEFFKTPEGWDKQLDNMEDSLTTYCNTLKSNYKDFFSKATDIYALGVVLLDDLQLDESSDLYNVVKKMIDYESSMRPSGELIHEAIRPLSKLAAESKMQGDSERRTGVYGSVHEDSSTESTQQFASAVEFR